MKEIVKKKNKKNKLNQDIYSFNTYEDREDEKGNLVSVKVFEEQLTKEELLATISNLQARVDAIDAAAQK